MKITRKFLSAAASFFCFLLVLAALLATLGMQLLGDFKTYVQISLKNVQEATGYKITLDDIGWDIVSGTGIKIDNLALFDAGGHTRLFVCRSAHIKFEALPLFSARLIVSSIILDEPQVHMYRDSAGAWRLPLIAPAAAGEAAGSMEAFSDFSVSLKRLFINNGSFHLDDRLRNVRLDLECIRARIDRSSEAEAYRVQLDARQGHTNSGLLSFAGNFQGLDPGFPDSLSGSGQLVITSARLMQLACFFYGNQSAADEQSLLNARIAVKLDPGWLFSLEGSADSDNMSVPIPGGQRLRLGRSSLAARALVSSGHVLLDSFDITLADTATLSGACSLDSRDGGSPYFELKCSSGKIPVSLVQDYAEALSLLPAAAQQVLAGATAGELVLKNAHIAAGAGKPLFGRVSKITAELELRDITLHISPQLPPVKVSRAGMILHENQSLSADVHAQWPLTDNHSLQIAVDSVFHDPQLTGKADSQLSAQGAQLFLDFLSASAQDSFRFESGRIAAQTRLSYPNNPRFSAVVDLQQAAFQAAGTIAKPEGIALRLSLRAAPDFKSGTFLPVAFSMASDQAAQVEGTLTGLKPLACTGAYHAREFDLSSLAITGMQGLMDVSGKLSGTGELKVPAAGSFPVEGSCSLKDFSLTATATGRQLVKGRLEGRFKQDSFKILSCRASMGETSGTFSGHLSQLVPTRGKLSIVADLFDIDDFVNIIDDFIAISDQIKSEAPEADTPHQKAGNLLLTDLDMPLKLKKLNLWDWDFDNGTCHWIFRDGVMNFNDITIQGGGGPISGSVVFDLSRLPVRTLTLSPRRSQSQFLWVVPALRKNRTITGTMDINGYFSSEFSCKQELGRNMAGKFHVTVTDGKLQKLTVFSKILEMMNLPHLFSLKSGELLSSGMPYDTITADFIVDHAVMKTDNLQMKGPAMNLSAVGTINMLNEHLDLTVGAQVLETFGKIIGSIPVAGSLMTGRDKTITLAYFKIAGTYQNSSVMPMPVKSISAPVIKIINSFLYYPRKLLHTAVSDNASIAEEYHQ